MTIKAWKAHSRISDRGIFPTTDLNNAERNSAYILIEDMEYDDVSKG